MAHARGVGGIALYLEQWENRLEPIPRKLRSSPMRLPTVLVDSYTCLLCVERGSSGRSQSLAALADRFDTVSRH